MKKSSAIFLALISSLVMQHCDTPEEALTERNESDSTAYYNHSHYYIGHRYYPYYNYYHPHYRTYEHHYYDHGGFGYYGTHHSCVS